MIKYLAIASLLLVFTACGGDPTPPLEPTPTAEIVSTPEPTATPVPPTSTPEPTATHTPVPTPTPLPATATVVQPTEQAEHRESINGQFDEIVELMESVEPLWTVYFHSDDWQTPGINTTMDEVFKLLKLENIFSHEGYQGVDPEMIVATEPDIIIADSLESILENPHLSGLHMVQDLEHVPHHIFVLGDDYSFNPDSHHFEDTIKRFAAFVYPDVFEHYGEEEEEDADQEEEHEHDHENGHSH